MLISLHDIISRLHLIIPTLTVLIRYLHTLVIHPSHLCMINHQIPSSRSIIITTTPTQLLYFHPILDYLILELLYVLLPRLLEHASYGFFTLILLLLFGVPVEPKLAGQHTLILVGIGVIQRVDLTV